MRSQLSKTQLATLSISPGNNRSQQRLLKNGANSPEVRAISKLSVDLRDVHENSGRGAVGVNEPATASYLPDSQHVVVTKT